MQLAWTGPPALIPYTGTGWDTCPALLASLAHKVLWNTTGKVKRRKKFGHLHSVVGNLKVGQFKIPLIFFKNDY